MGLPSGTKWAPFNIGANAPEQTGFFFAWGDTQGHREGSGYDFSQANYDASPAAQIDTNLTLQNDMARVNLGEPWRMPTKDEFLELINNCTVEWTTRFGVNGRLFTSNINGNSIFLPAAGYCINESTNDKGRVGYYWESTYDSNMNAYALDFSNTIVSAQALNSRYLGFNVRAVQSPQ